MPKARFIAGLFLAAFLTIAPSNAQEANDECPYPKGRKIEDLPAARTAHLQWLAQERWDDPTISGRANFCNADLRSANLERANLTGANLEGANLITADLEGANLITANLEGANLFEANLEGAILRSANLKGANLVGASLEEADLVGAKLQGANLRGAILRGAILPWANLEGAVLRSANLEGANLVGASLEEADLVGAKLQGANLFEANLQEADLTETNLGRVNLAWSNLEGANLSGAILEKAILSRADLQSAKLPWANIQRAELRMVNLQGANLFEANLQGADLFEADLGGANLFEANLREADLTATNLQEADLGLANLQDAYLFKANLQGAGLAGADLQRVVLIEANLRDTNLDQSILSNAILLRADLAGALYQPATAPASGSLSGLKGLRSVWFCPGETSGLVQLREAFKEVGLRDAERLATNTLERIRTGYSLARWSGHVFEGKECPDLEKNRMAAVEGMFRLIFFEWTTAYGLAYGRPILILLSLIGVFTLVYLPALVIAPKNLDGSGIYRIWPEGRIRRSGAKVVPADDVVIDRLKPRGLSILAVAFYFSVISAFHLGWRDLNVGTWIARLQSREYALRANGWVRVVSGVQSLISVYLVAMWALTYFGRPFG